MRRAQNNRCAICGRRSRKRLAVDHSHITGTVRGLLCNNCNRDVVGPIDGDLAKIDAAIAFLTAMRNDLIAFHTNKEHANDPTHQ
jgi:hypothetical protein